MSVGWIFTLATFMEGLLAGTFVGSSMMEHAARTLGSEHWIAYNRAKDAIYGPVMPLFFGVTLLLAVVASFVAPDRGLQAFAALCLAIVGIVTARVHVPLNRAFGRWSPSAFPGDWHVQRDRWRRWNMPRCLLSILAFAVTVWR